MRWILAQALLRAVLDHDNAALDDHSDTVLPQVWRYQEFSAWMTDTMHDAGDPTQHGTFRKRVARARLAVQLTRRPLSCTANTSEDWSDRPPWH